jgi:putative ABC transport system substrate-binding protein
LITRRKLVQYVPFACGMAAPALAAPEPRVIGLLSPFYRADAVLGLERFEAEMFRLGYAKGTHYRLIERMAEGHNERLRGMAEDLVNLKVDLIVALTTNAVIEAQKATSTIPIVFMSVADPVGAGFAISLAHPGYNLTGVSNFVGDLPGKRLELLKQMVPGLTRMVALLTSKTPNVLAKSPGFQKSADALGVGMTSVEAPLPLNLEEAFKSIAASRPQAIYVLGDPYLWNARVQLADLALRARLPTMFVVVEHVEVGGLMSYAADTQDWMRQVAIFVDKIFRGAKPGDLPIEQPSKIDLVINRKTADALGLKIPQALLIQAVRVID